jgi:AcrR family transcriptional regulator
VLQAAFAIVDADGGDAFTMRRLASDLDVAAMAIYNHFADRSAVLDALAEYVFAAHVTHREQTDRTRKSSKALAWRENIRRIVMDVHSLALKHPHIFLLAISRPQKPEALLQLMSSAMRSLRDAGLNDRQAVTAYHSIVMMLQGFPYWHASMQRHCGNEATVAGRLHNPEMARDWKALHGVEATTQFARSLDWLLDSIEHTAKR